jgi:hypothetical protein
MAFRHPAAGADLTVAGHTLSTSQTTVRLLQRLAHETVTLYARQ